MKHTDESRAAISRAMKGRRPSPSTLAAVAAANRLRTGETHWAWKGDAVGYGALHVWVTRHKGRAALQPCTMANDTCAGPMEWANVSHEYRRDLDDFMALCYHHHRWYDNLEVA